MILSKRFFYFCFERAYIKLKPIFLFLFGVLTLLIFSACTSIREKTDETMIMSLSNLQKEGQKALVAEDWSRCNKYFLAIQARETFGSAAEQAQLNAAYCSYRDNAHDAAQTLLNRFIQLYPEYSSLDYVYYLKGLITFNDSIGFLGKLSGQNLAERDPEAMKLSYEAFHFLVEKFPQSPYAADASQKMRYLVNALAGYEVHVAKTYYQRGAYLAALNRAQKALKEYENTPYIEEALNIVINSYLKLGDKKLAESARRVLEKKMVSNN